MQLIKWASSMFLISKTHGKKWNAQWSHTFLCQSTILFTSCQNCNYKWTWWINYESQHGCPKISCSKISQLLWKKRTYWKSHKTLQKGIIHKKSKYAGIKTWIYWININGSSRTRIRQIRKHCKQWRQSINKCKS